MYDNIPIRTFDLQGNVVSLRWPEKCTLTEGQKLKVLSYMAEGLNGPQAVNKVMNEI